MSATAEDREVKICCATFYQSEVARMLLGDVYHPGGLALTRHLGDVIALRSNDHVLDVACGRGRSAVHLAAHFGCTVTGVDFGSQNVAAAEALAAESGVAHLTTFRQGDAEHLPFDDNIFDAIVSECSFCTFADKVSAAAEMARVLRPGGRLGLTDMVVAGPLPGDVQTLLAWVACVAGAGTVESYTNVLRGAGFFRFRVEDQGDALLDMVTDVRRKFLGLEIAAGLGKLDLAGLDLDEAKRLARRAAELIERGSVGYALVSAHTKEDAAA